MNEMKDKVCIVTGSNSGMGKETALALANMGAKVVMVVRNPGRGEKALAEVVSKTGNHSTSLMICALSSIGSIRRFAGDFKDKHDRLTYWLIMQEPNSVSDKPRLTGLR